MRVTMLVCAPLLALAACTTPTDTQPRFHEATDADVSQIWGHLTPWHNCVVLKTVHLDDGKSDPYTIARTAVDSCDAEFLTVQRRVDAMGLYPDYTDGFLNAARKKELTDSVAAILEHRKSV